MSVKTFISEATGLLLPFIPAIQYGTSVASWEERHVFPKLPTKSNQLFLVPKPTLPTDQVKDITSLIGIIL